MSLVDDRESLVALPKPKLLLGNEAIALAACDAGIAGAFSYPGTPATEIFEAVQKHGEGVWSQWSTNEKVAYEEALGMSYVGKRSLVSMKHVGLNVAADPFMSSALTGIQGGLVIALGDDPGMHSSQNEQDSRFFADFAKIPCFEPGSQQDCYDMTREAYAISEQFHVPVMMRMVTRLAHSRSTVVPHSSSEEDRRNDPVRLPDPNEWTLVPFNARRRYGHLLNLQSEFVKYSESSRFNKLKVRGKRGIIATGIARNYVHEVLGGESDYSTLTIGFQPFPVALIRELIEHCEEITVFEDGYPLLESQIRGILGLPNKRIRGRMDLTTPAQGELTPEIVGRALGIPFGTNVATDPIVEDRPPQLCKGCPHGDSFSALMDAVAEYENPILFSDIGCYTLAVMPPYRAVHSCVDMGASIGMGHGAVHAGAFPVVCTIGDSTFGHSGIQPLLSALQANTNMTVIILDNATTAMTGTQESLTTGEELISILKGIGIQDLHIVEPLRKNHASTVDAIKGAIAYEGLSVIVSRRACIHWKSSRPTPSTLPQVNQGGELE